MSEIIGELFHEEEPAEVKKEPVNLTFERHEDAEPKIVNLQLVSQHPLWVFSLLIQRDTCFGMLESLWLLIWIEIETATRAKGFYPFSHP